MVVLVEIVGRRIVGDQEVHPAIIVNVDEYGRQAKVSRGIGDTGLFADVGERAVAVVVEQVITLANKSARAAHHLHAAELTRTGWKRSLGGSRRMTWIEFDIARNEKV